ncbi:MAG: hypothetical protein RBR23_01520 [Arcobacteraceae bacterium]|nr:hypothetical protein [Arcobacteraceae bacterium]
MIEIIAVSASQMALVFLKHINIRLIVRDRVWLSLITTFLVQASWLVASAIGINGFLNGEWHIVVFYLLGGVIGSYINFKIKV